MATWDDSVKTWVAGETLLASDFNSQIAGPLAALSGAWNAYTPTISGFTLGNGTAVGAYIRVGSFVVFRAGLTFGSTTTAAASSCNFTLPVTATSAAAAQWPLLSGYVTDNSTGSAWQIFARISSTTVAAAFLTGTSGQLANFSTTSPMTWATSDTIAIAGIYEAA